VHLKTEEICQFTSTQSWT